MRLNFIGVVMLVSSVLLSFSSTVAAKEPPVAKLVQVNGNVEYSRNGTTWRRIRRTKYLFAGYHIRTGEEGSGKLVNQSSGKSQDLGANSLIKVGEKSIDLISGNLSKPKQESGSIFEGLANKFAKVQRYTTVRRSATTPTNTSSCDSKVRTIKELSLSSSHPDLVWRNACPEHSYRLIIDGVSVEIPAESTSEMIRYTVSNVKPGEHSYRVEVLDKDGTVYIPRKDSTFTWLTEKDEQALMANLKQAGDDVFIATDLMEASNMTVAAMDAYREYFQENPDDNDMRPLLIGSYNDLKLSNLKDSEARLYNASLEEDF
jgi:hypothetical protein